MGRIKRWFQPFDFTGKSPKTWPDPMMLVTGLFIGACCIGGGLGPFLCGGSLVGRVLGAPFILAGLVILNLIVRIFWGAMRETNRIFREESAKKASQ